MTVLFLLIGRERYIDLTGLRPLQAFVTHCWCGFQQGAVGTASLTGVTRESRLDVPVQSSDIKPQ